MPNNSNPAAKRCYACRQYKPVAEFYRNKTKPDGLSTACKYCDKDAVRARTTLASGKAREKFLNYQRAYNRRNKVAKNTQSRRYGQKNAIKIRARKYGITEERFQMLLINQQHKCAICRKKETLTYRGKPRQLHIDHCHQSGQVRGLLCSRCNLAIGQLGHDPLRIRAAINYLQNAKNFRLPV